MSDNKLDQLLDRIAVQDTVIRYAIGLDMRDWEMYRSVFTDEIEVHFDFWSDEPRTQNADDFVAGVRQGLSGFKATQHVSTNHVIDIRGDEATCISYLIGTHYLPNDKGDNAFTIGGYYTNDLVRTAGGWKIRRCKLNVTWSEGNRYLFDLARQNNPAP